MADPRTVIRRVDGAAKLIDIDWADGHRSSFHAIWLRDNCHCRSCGNAANGYRYLRVTDLPPTVAPDSIALDDAGHLNVVWQPGSHASRYEPAWLRRHCYSASERARRRHRPVLWDAALQRPPEIGHDELLSGDGGHLRLMEMVRDHGIARISGVPTVAGELERVASMLGYIEETNFGRVFDIVRTAEQKSIANSALPLVLHTDEPYRYRAPGILLFHCLVANPEDGGVSTYVDGFHVAETLRQADPAAFRLLSEHPMRYRRLYDDEVDLQASARMIELDADGQVVGIRINDRVAAPLELPPAVVEPFYAAFAQLLTLCDREQAGIAIGLRPGDLMLIDNDRILHGRTGFRSGAGPRHFRQAHVARADFHGRLRILARRLGREGAESRLPAGSGG